MNQTTWLDIFNSSVTFFLLLAVVIGIWLILIKLDLKKNPHSKSSKR